MIDDRSINIDISIMNEKDWRLTIPLSPDFKRRYKVVAALKNMTIQDFGLKAVEAAIEAAEQELVQQKRAA